MRPAYATTIRFRWLSYAAWSKVSIAGGRPLGRSRALRRSPPSPYIAGTGASLA